MAIQIGNEKLSAEAPKTHGNFLETLKAWLSETKGAFDFMSTIKKTAELSGNQHLRAQAQGYIAATSVPRIPGTAMTLYNSYQKYRADRHLTPRVFADVSHQVTDFLTTCAYSIAFFSKAPQRALSTAAGLGLANDVTDAAACITQITESSARLEKTKVAPLVYRANQNEVNHSWIKLAKAIVAIVAGIFACYLLLTGVALVPPMIAVAVSLASSLLSIMGYYYQNYCCDVMLKAEYKPIKFV
jgi:hypothetical protein